MRLHFWELAYLRHIISGQGYNMNLIIASTGWLLFNLQETPTLASYKTKLTIKSIKDPSTILHHLLCELGYGLWTNDWFPSETRLCLKHSLETTDRHSDHWSVKKPDTRPCCTGWDPRRTVHELFVLQLYAHCLPPQHFLSEDLPFSGGKKNLPLDWHCKHLFCDVGCISGFRAGWDEVL